MPPRGAPRATTHTSWPNKASSTARYPPIAPAPNTQNFIGQSSAYALISPMIHPNRRCATASLVERQPYRFRLGEVLDRGFAVLAAHARLPGSAPRQTHI